MTTASQPSNDLAPARGAPVPSMEAGGIIVTYELITPGIAREMLEGNTHNRSVNQKQVNKIAGLHGTKFWVETGDPIRLTHDGVIVDGQHRLLAITQSGIPTYCFVMRGVKLTAQEVIDTGSRRTLSSMLHTRKEKNRSTLGAVIKVIYGWESGLRSAQGQASESISVLLEFFDRNPDLMRDVASKAKRVGNEIRGGAAATGLTIWLFDQIDEDDANYFWDRLLSEFGHSEGDPISVLRRTLIKDAQGAPGNQASNRGQTWRAAVTVKAWNAYRRGEQVYRLQYSPGGSRPENFPEPI